jgi:hypothetical protein
MEGKREKGSERGHSAFSEKNNVPFHYPISENVPMLVEKALAR